VIGPFCSEVTLPASTIFADNGTVEITLSSNSQITEQGFDGLFRITGRDDQQGSVLADFIAEQHAGKRVALVTDHSAYDVALAAGLRDALKSQGKVVIALDQSIEAGTRDFSALVSAFAASKSDIVVYIGYPLEAGLIINQAAQAGLKLEYLSANNMSSRKIWELAGRNAEGLAFTFLPAAELFLPAQDVVAQFKAKGRKTDGYTLYAYAAVEVLAAGLERAKTTQKEAVATELQKGEIPTVLGDVSFDDKGDNLLPGWQIFNWIDGSYIYFNGE
jgi:branched-chain amino acid transport system substrate-binding protein